MGPFEKLKQGLKKTAQFLNTDIRDLFKSEGQLVDDAFVDRLFETLIKTDMGVEAAREIADEIRANFRARVATMDEILEYIKARLKVMLAQPAEPIRYAPSGPTVVMVAGVNGAGKTTSIAKLAAMFQGEGKRVILGAADTFRAVAVEQLTIWAGGWARRSSPPPPAAIRRAWPIAPSPEPSRRARTCASSTLPAGCKPSRT